MPCATWRRAIGWAIALGLFAHALVLATSASPRTTAISHSHANKSLILALNWAVCGRYSSWSPTYGPQLAGLVAQDSSLSESIANLPARVAGSREAYCQSVSRTFVHAENTLMLIEAGYIFLVPDATVQDLDFALRWLQRIMLLPFVAVAIRAGASLLLASGIWFAGLVTNLLVNDAIPCSAYGFLGPAVALLSAGCAVANDIVARRGAVAATLAGLGLGLIAAFVTNLRTSYAPIVAACLAAGFLCLSRGIGRPALARGVSALGGIVVAWAGFHLLFIASIDPRGEIQRASTEHHFYHPLVLGLANPPNDLARSEGIAWADAVGFDLAVRTDPSLASAESLWSIPIARYESALRSYYIDLWRNRTLDMLQVYWLKWQVSTRDLFWFIPRNVPEPLRALSAAAAPALANGVVFSAIFLVLGLVVVAGVRPETLVATTLLATMCAVELLLGLESAAILSGFYLTHQSALLLFTLIAELVAAQVVIDGLATIPEWLRRRTK